MPIYYELKNMLKETGQNFWQKIRKNKAGTPPPAEETKDEAETDEASTETNQEQGKTPMINKFLNQIDSYMNPPRLIQLREEWSGDFNDLIAEIKNYEGAISLDSAEAKEKAQTAKQKFAVLVDSYLDETLEKSKIKNTDNPYRQVDALRQRVEMIEDILPRIDEYKPDKQDKLGEIRKNIATIEKSYSHK